MRTERLRKKDFVGCQLFPTHFSFSNEEHIATNIMQILARRQIASWTNPLSLFLLLNIFGKCFASECLTILFKKYPRKLTC